MSIKVSILICAYNAESYIQKCLNSIPIRDDLEVILLDDCSSDKTIEQALPILKKFKSYTLLKNSINMGVGFNRNVLIDNSKGEYIFFLDADDYLYKDNFTRVLDEELKDQSILKPKYMRNDRFSGYPTILRGCFIKKDYVGNVRHDPNKRCFEDVNFRNNLTFYHDGVLDITLSPTIIYHYNLPRENSITWNHWKRKGLPGYQKDLGNWEVYYNGKAR